MITFESKGSFKKTETFLNYLSKGSIFDALEGYAREGVAALAAATPVESGLAASSWGYEIKQTNGSYSITWTNSNIENGFPVAIMLQYGYSTGTGGWVQGQDYINPALKPIFDKIADKVWKAVTSA